MPRPSVKSNTVALEETREFVAAERAFNALMPMYREEGFTGTQALEHARYNIDLPAYILNDPDDMVHSAWGMGLDYASQALSDDDEYDWC